MNRILKWSAIALICEGMGGCAHTPAPPPAIKIQTVETKIPVGVQCRSEVTVHKSYSDAAAEFLTDIRDQAAALLQGRKERMADAERLKGGVVGCGGTVTAQ